MSPTLLERIARGDGTAVLACMSTYGGLVWSLARRHSTDMADAEDAVQEIFVDLWRNAGRYNPRIAAEATFVAMVTRRRLTDRARKRCRTIATSPLPEDCGTATSSGDQTIDTSDEVSAIRARMAELSPEQRQVLEMAIDQDMSQSDISSTLGMPLGTVKAHARRGLMRLRELVGIVRPEPAREGVNR